ncbi:MAG: hypothetical protein AAGD06_21455 [Acidobacteriota bacterium]
MRSYRSRILSAESRPRWNLPFAKPRGFLLFALIAAAVLFPVSGATADTAFPDRFVGAIEAAHGADAWWSQRAVSADIAVDFGGQRVLEGRLLTDTPGGRVRIELVDGSVMVFDGKDAWTSPADSAAQGARFHLLTWPYFLAAPMKLRDPGTHLEDLGDVPLADGRTAPAARLTFSDGIGDTPEDWYVVYRNRDSDRLAAMAYIVTFGKDLAKAEEEPHVIVYGAFKDIDGVTVPTRWSFYDWNSEQGVVGEPIGRATLDNVRFVDPAADAFVAPRGSRPEPAP